MELEIFPVMVGTQCFAVATSAVIMVLRLADAGGAPTAVHTRQGRVPVCDLAIWANEPADTARRTLLLTRWRQQPMGVMVDSIGDRQTLPLLELPPLLHDASVDPSIIGAVLLDDLPSIVLDLEAFALIHMPLAHALDSPPHWS